MKRKKSNAELVDSFFLNCSEIQRLFEMGRISAGTVFDRAQEIDKRELGVNYFDYMKVRLSSVLRVLGIREDELRRKVKGEQT